jgi:hypothetical protein
MNKYLLGILLIVIIVFLYTSSKKESMTSISKLYGNKIENIKSGTRTYDDALFDDVKSYENDPNDALNTGVYKCLDNCDGNCVEYGMTGLAYCFPKNKN